MATLRNADNFFILYNNEHSDNNNWMHIVYKHFHNDAVNNPYQFQTILQVNIPLRNPI